MDEGQQHINMILLFCFTAKDYLKRLPEGSHKVISSVFASQGKLNCVVTYNAVKKKQKSLEMNVGIWKHKTETVP